MFSGFVGEVCSLKESIMVGEKFRDFSLEDQDEKLFNLKGFKGKRVLLSFHPLAWTSVCSEQMKSLEKNKAVFEKLNTIAVGLSVDSSPCKRAWAKSLGIIGTRLLADFWPHGEVAILYGLFNDESGTARRANVIVDEKQKVVFVKVYPSSKLPDIEEVIEALKRLS
jgi:peroxiredoxin